MRSTLQPIVLLAVLTVFASPPDAQTAQPSADRVLVLKSAHKLELLSHGTVVKSYRIALGEPKGSKIKAGDRKTPEGVYYVDEKKSQSRFYRALHLSYPNQADRARARQLNVDPGGDIEIHGLPHGFAWLSSSQRLIDWTSGCIAVTDSEIDEIWRYVPVGTPVEIRP